LVPNLGGNGPTYPYRTWTQDFATREASLPREWDRSTRASLALMSLENW
jgi:hypothetical protein